jgi:maltooligosyltrehalose trehalohydrolase
LDGLRLDAIQTIHDDSPVHIVAEIQENVQRLAHEQGRKVCVIGETDENKAAYVLSRSSGGMGLNAVWSDDFHHAVHALLTGEREGYYQDFGSKEQLLRALSEGFVFQGKFFKFWNRGRGTPSHQMPLPAHVICIQNHDQIGNRALGDRLSTLVPRGAYKLAAALMLLAPETPLLFMGEEYGETAPFQFFTDYGDPALRKAVSEGRRNEFKNFLSFGGEVPDPQDPQSFETSKLSWDLTSSKNADMLNWYRQLITIRKTFISAGERSCKAELIDGNIMALLPAEQPRIVLTLQFPNRGSELPKPTGDWDELLASDEDGYRVQVYAGRR